jgi:hypothetical protein
VMLPGSRRNEVRAGLSLHLEAARALHVRDPRVHFAIASRGPASSGPSPRPAFPRSSRSRSSRGVPTSCFALPMSRSPSRAPSRWRSLSSALRWWWRPGRTP